MFDVAPPFRTYHALAFAFIPTDFLKNSTLGEIWCKWIRSCR